MTKFQAYPPTADTKPHTPHVSRPGCFPEPDPTREAYPESALSAEGMEVRYPDDNPKTLSGVSKVPLHLVPPSAKYYLAEAFEDGAAKYGPYNWRQKTVSVSIYKAAAERHLDAFWDGEDYASDSGVHHLAHAMACMAIVLDAMTVGRLRDDRPTSGAAAVMQAGYAKRKSDAVR